MSRYPSESVARMDQQFRETPDEREEEKWRKERAHMKAERDNLSADLAKLREAVRVRPSKKAMLEVRDTLEAMEACGDIDAAALRLLVEMYDNLENI